MKKKLELSSAVKRTISFPLRLLKVLKAPNGGTSSIQPVVFNNNDDVLFFSVQLFLTNITSCNDLMKH